MLLDIFYQFDKNETVSVTIKKRVDLPVGTLFKSRYPLKWDYYELSLVLISFLFFSFFSVESKFLAEIYYLIFDVGTLIRYILVNIYYMWE